MASLLENLVVKTCLADNFFFVFYFKLWLNASKGLCSILAIMADGLLCQRACNPISSIQHLKEMVYYKIKWEHLESLTKHEPKYGQVQILSFVSNESHKVSAALHKPPWCLFITVLFMLHFIHVKLNLNQWIECFHQPSSKLGICVHPIRVKWG